MIGDYSIDQIDRFATIGTPGLHGEQRCSRRLRQQSKVVEGSRTAAAAIRIEAPMIDEASGVRERWCGGRKGHMGHGLYGTTRERSYGACWRPGMRWVAEGLRSRRCFMAWRRPLSMPGDLEPSAARTGSRPARAARLCFLKMRFSICFLLHLRVHQL